jgi:hypothetical protein
VRPGPAETTPGRERRRAIAAGVAAVAAYAALAAWSGALSPLARGPLLDGLAPVNYRWVSPPPELAATNRPPSSGRFTLPLGKGGVGTQVVFTDDSQVTVVVDDGSIGPMAGQRSVELLVEPVDPADLGELDGELAAFGNAYRFSASFRPSGEPVRRLDRPLQVVLVYPATTTLHATSHDVMFSPNGERWKPLETTDSPAQQQAQGDLPAFGYIVVAAEPTPFPTVAPAPGGGGTPPVAIALLVAAGVVLLLGIGLFVRSRGN